MSHDSRLYFEEFLKNDDVIRLMLSFMDITDIVRFESTTKCSKTTEDFWIDLALSRYSLEFWSRAFRRKKVVFQGFKKELYQLEVFQRKHITCFGKPIEEQEFPKLWNFLDGTFQNTMKIRNQDKLEMLRFFYVIFNRFSFETLACAILKKS